MATSTYMTGRKKYQRPQAMLWSENAGTLTNGLYIPRGYEIGANTGSETDTSLFDQFLVLSDDNRSAIDFKPIRLEVKERMINGRMRSYHIGDKLSLTVSWTMLPSRAFALPPDFGSNGKSTMTGNNSQEYTTDGGAGGVEILDWYNNHAGPFWVFLAYDNYANFGKEDAAYGHLGQYNEIVEMYFSDFSYSVQKRGSSNFDFWNISLTLEEA